MNDTIAYAVEVLDRDGEPYSPRKFLEEIYGYWVVVDKSVWSVTSGEGANIFCYGEAYPSAAQGEITIDDDVITPKRLRIVKVIVTMEPV